MTTLIPVFMAIAYAFAMYRISVWRSAKTLNENSHPLREPEITAMAQRLARALDLTSIQVHVYAVDPVNGLAAPDGRIFLTEGFLRKYRAGEVTAPEIASVVAHELGHVALGHSRRRMIDYTGQNILRLVLIGVLGWWSFHPEYLRIPEPQDLPGGGYAQAIATTAALTLWAFIGLESATVPAEHVRDPKRTIPRATIFGTLVAAAVYILSITAVQGVLPPEVLMHSSAPFADAAQVLLGDWGYYLVAGGAVIACLGALNGWVLLQGQIPMAAARDGLLPEALATCNKRNVPANGLWVSAVLVSLLVLIDGRGELVDVFQVIILLGTMAGVVPYAFCTAALLQLLAVKPEAFKPRERKPLVAIALLGFIYSMWALYGTGEQAIFWGFLVLMAGIPLYTWRQWRNRVQGEARALQARALGE